MSTSLKKNDDVLLSRIKAGDKTAFTELYNAYWKPLFISSYNLLKDKERCEEIIQDIFLDFWKKKDTIDINTSLKGYLYACVRYKVFSEFRKTKIHNVALFENLDMRFHQSTPETKMMYQELIAHIDTVVKTLPKKCQNVYLLSRQEQLSHKEIAQKLNISTKTVESHISIALRTIKKSFGSSYSWAMLLFIIDK